MYFNFCLNQCRLKHGLLTTKYIKQKYKECHHIRKKHGGKTEADKNAHNTITQLQRVYPIYFPV